MNKIFDVLINKIMKKLFITLCGKSMYLNNQITVKCGIKKFLKFSTVWKLPSFISIDIDMAYREAVDHKFVQ